MFPSKDAEKPVEIPYGQLSPDALTGVIENFIVREGTDYGAIEISYDKKCEQVRRQIARGEIKIIFDLETETIGLLTERDYKRIYKG